MVKAFINNENIKYYETSCINGNNIDNVFTSLVDGVLNKV